MLTLQTAEDAASIRHRKPDPWAHRRGEPRIFALIWTIFLFIATISIFFAAMAGPAISPEIMRPAARLLLLLTVAGIAILWPMVRLSQLAEVHPLGGAFQDFIVLMVPAQALIWPQTMWWLARWPLATVAALAVGIALWSLFIGGLIAFAQTGRAAAKEAAPEVAAAPPPPRPSFPVSPLCNASWMLAFIAISLGGLVAALLGTDAGGISGSAATGDVHPGQVNVALMLSPLGMVLELTRDASWRGLATPLTPQHWQLIGLLGVLSAAVWIAAAIRSRHTRAGLRLSSER